MRSNQTLRAAAVLALLVFTVAASCLPSRAHAGSLPLVQATGPRLEAGGKPFVEFGFTYGFASRQPITSYLDDPTAEKLGEIDRQMAQARELGANTLRIRIQPRQILTSLTSVDHSSLEALRNLLQVAEQNHIYLDITGLFAADLDQVPPWYDELDTSARWQAQALFWRAVSRVASSSSAVLEYELVSEPIVPPQPVSSWYMTDPSSTYPHPQYLVKDPAGQTPVSLARQWIQKMTRAVRLNDSQHLISIGMLPFASQSFSLAPQHVSDLLDTLTPHLYPRTGKVDSAVERISRFAATGKPVILGETFALHSGFPTVRDFLLQARPYLDGFLGYYDGRNVDQATADGDPLSMTYARFLESFVRLRPQLCLYRCQMPG